MADISIAGLQWDIRNAGDDANGAFYDPSEATTDYSQQAVAQATFTNLSTDVAGTRVTDDDGGNLMTDQFPGNGLNIGGVYYKITNYVDANTVDIDRSAGSSLSGLSGKVGGSRATLNTAFFGNFAGTGNYSHIMSDGDYTVDINTAIDGTQINPNKLIGYEADHYDAPVGNNKPTLIAGAGDISFDNYWYAYNLKGTGSSAELFDFDFHALFSNCDSVNTSNGAAFHATQSNPQFINCSAESDSGIGFDVGINAKFTNCIAKDCGTIGISANSTASILNCILDSCAVGVAGASVIGIEIKNCTFYNCTTYGIDMSNAELITILDNSFSDCLTGIFDTSGLADDHSFIGPNHYHNNGTDLNGMSAHPDDLSGDPEFPGSGDFSSGSATDVTITFADGLSESSYKMGAIQTSGGVSGASFGWV